MTKADFDVVVIGGGPAGLTAGLYAGRARMKSVLIEKLVPGGQVLNTDWVENYPGFPDGVSGYDLVEKMTHQAKRFELPFETGEILEIVSKPPILEIKLTDRTITTYTAIIASGASPKRLGIPGEDVFYGKGISSCATCDGPFFRDKMVVAVGGGDTAVQESLFLTKFVKKVYLIHRRDQLRATQIFQERAFNNDKIEMIWDSALTRIDGLTHVESVQVKNLKSGELITLPVDGCFIWIGILPNSDFVKGLVDMDDYGFIRTDCNMQTCIPGLFAAGDVRDTPLRQISTAVGDGALAAFSASHYLENLENQIS